MSDHAARRYLRFLSRKGLRAGAVGAVAASVVALAACQPPGESASSSSTSGASYFKGKTITLIAPDAPGGSYDSYARLFAPYVAKELGATINVENVPTAGTVQGTNEMAAASPNGLTIGMVNVGGDIASLVEKQSGQEFDMAKLSWIGQPAPIPNAIVTQPGSKVTSFDAMVKSSDPVSALDIRNGIGDMLIRVIYGAFGAKYQMDTGFESTSALKQGFIAKDGQTILEAMSTLYPLITGNEAKAVLEIGGDTLPAYQKALAGVPTLQSELATKSLPAPQKAAVTEALNLSNLSDTFAAPAGLPAGELTALRNAFAKAAVNSQLKAQATKESLPLAWISGPSAASQVKTALAKSSTIAPYVK
jgi:tripartite-type tricarboxylate transporter receptor subunit TctC